MLIVKGKLETTMELKSAPEKFYNLWKKEAHKIPNYTPSYIQNVNVYEGSWDTPDSILVWNYTCDGKEEMFKESVENDDATMSVTLNGLEGEAMDLYKVYRPTWHLSPNGTGALAKIILVFEKRDPNVPSPDNYLAFMVGLTKDIDQGLTTA